jgi:hypothetical protein
MDDLLKILRDAGLFDWWRTVRGQKRNPIDLTGQIEMQNRPHAIPPKATPQRRGIIKENRLKQKK